MNGTLSQGQTVHARYRCANDNGFSVFSDTAYLEVAGVPERPPRPLYLSSTATTIELQILPVIDNNGAIVTKYHLYRDLGDYSSTVSTPVTGYNGMDSTYTVTGLTPGVMYRFIVQAENSVGLSLQSYQTIAIAARLPSAPTMLYKNTLLSNKTAISVYWNKVADTETETSGYLLMMAEYGSQEFKTIYDGTSRPLKLDYTATGLTTGKQYIFKLIAMNFNGESPESPDFVFNACNTPSAMAAPNKVSSTQTSITLSWEKPTEDGGCPIIGYAVFRDDGAGGSLVTEVNSANDPLVREIPTLRQLTVTNFVGVSSTSIRFKVTAYNREGSKDSSLRTMLLAGPPSNPSSKPVLVQDETSDSQITVTLPLIPDADNGNSAIISYEL